MTTGDILLFIFYGIIFTAMLLCLYILWRNEQVHKFRGKLLDQISEASKADIDRAYSHMRREIDEGKSPDLTRAELWKWRYDAYDQVGYHEMVLKFWKGKPENFYDNLDFADPETHGPRA